MANRIRLSLRIKSIFTSAIAAVTLFTHAHFATAGCVTQYRDVMTLITTPKDGLDYGTYEAWVKKFKAEPKPTGPFPIGTVNSSEALLAYFDVYGKWENFDALQMSSFLKTASKEEQERLIEVFNQLLNSSEHTQASTVQAVHELYLITHGFYGQGKAFERKYAQFFLHSHDLLQKKLELAIAKKGVGQALSDLGLIHEKELEIFLKSNAMKPISIKNGVAVAANAASAHYLGGLLYAPKLRFFEPSEELITQFLEGGGKLKIPVGAKAELTYSRLRTLMTTYILYKLGELLVKNAAPIGELLKGGMYGLLHRNQSKEQLEKTRSARALIQVLNDQLASEYESKLDDHQRLDPAYLAENAKSIFSQTPKDLNLDPKTMGSASPQEIQAEWKPKSIEILQKMIQQKKIPEKTLADYEAYLRAKP